MPHARRSLLVASCAVLMWLLSAAPAAMAMEVVLQFEYDEEAIAQGALFLPDKLVAGAEVTGFANLRWPAEPGKECGRGVSFEFVGTIQPSRIEGITDIRGTVDRTMTTGCDDRAGQTLGRGDFELSVDRDSATGQITFPDESRPRLMTGQLLDGRGDSAGSGGLDGAGVNLAFGLFAAAAVADFGATGLCLLKRKRIWFVLGLGLSALVTASAIDAYKVGSDDGLMELGMLVGFGIVVAPLSVALLVAASQPAKPKSWWATHKAQTNAPPPPPAVLAAQPPPPPNQPQL